MGGDALMLLQYLGFYRTIGYAQFFYDGMIIFGGVSLLFIALGNVKVITVEEVNKKLFDVESLMSDLVMQSPDAICIFDVEGRAVMANAAFIGLTGKRQCDVIGKFNIFREAEAYVQGAREKVRQVRDDEIPIYEGTTQVTTAAGDNKYYLIKLFPTRGQGGSVTSYIVMMADITERKNYEEKLKEAKNEAELYLDLMSHDINNIDQIALGFLELVMGRPDLSGETRELISRPMGALDSSTRLIQNVRKLRQVRDNGLKLCAMDAGQVLRDAARQYTNIPGRDVTITENIRGDCKVMANNLLSDVFSNIIGNSVSTPKAI
jgi:PAS domain S-box-containing protein